MGHGWSTLRIATNDPLYRPVIQAWPRASPGAAAVIRKLANRTVSLKTSFCLLAFFFEHVSCHFGIHYCLCCGLVGFFPPQDFSVIYLQTTKALDSCTKLFASSSKPWVTLQTMIWFVSALCAFMLFIFSFGNCIKPIALVISCRICVEFPLLGNFTNKLQATFYASLNLICHFSVQLFQNKKYCHCNWIFKENKQISFYCA